MNAVQDIDDISLNIQIQVSKWKLSTVNRLSLLAGIGFALLGVAYLSVPKSIYHFGLDSLRSTQSEPSQPSNAMMWVFRFIGACLVVVSISYLV